MKTNIKIAASLICADPLNIEKDLNQLIKSNVELIHFDVMDGNFVPRYGLYPEILKRIKLSNKCPEVDVHMMVNNPEDYIELYSDAGADYYCFHIESTNHPHRIIKKVLNSGVKAGVALNPNTSLDCLKWIIQDLSMVVLMTINPGIVGHKFIDEMYIKISELKQMANKYNPKLLIEIDGGVTPQNIDKLIDKGANTLVCGNGTIFRPHEDTIINKVESIRKILNR
jgi:ribulose-phosphate 3-epimerase